MLVNQYLSHLNRAGVAAIDTGDGGRSDGPWVDAARRAAVAGATVATAAGGLRNGAAV
jgi:hypothetical protein